MITSGENTIVRASTFRMPGRAGTTGQNLFSLYNQAGSTTRVRINKLFVNHTCTVVKAVTVLPPTVRVYKVSVEPTNGDLVTKVLKDSTYTSHASVIARQDASADGTSSASALTATLPAGNVLTSNFAPRLITAASREIADGITFLHDADVFLRAGEGVVVALDYTLATQNPVTDMWIVNADWSTY